MILNIKKSLIALSLLSLTILQGCSGVTLLKEANALNEVGRDEILITGSIELIPKLMEDEQHLNLSGSFDILDYAGIFRNKCIIQVNSSAKIDAEKTIINPTLGETFFFKIPRNSPYLVAGNIQMEFGGITLNSGVLLPMGLKLDIKKKDKAIYIGHFKYTRDDFNSVIKVELLDNYSKALKDFKRKFGRNKKLRKSLARPI